MRRLNHRQRGIAMMMVLTVVTAACVMGLTYLSIASVKLTCSTNLVRANRAIYLSESGIQHAMWLIRSDGTSLLAASAASPMGPYQVDSDGGYYTMYAVFGGGSGEYTLVSKGVYDGISRTSTVAVRVTNEFADTLQGMGPAHYWRLGEISGTKAKDIAGTQDGEYVNGVQLGQVGPLCGDDDPAVHFDGADDYVDLDGLDITSNRMTMLCWFKTDDFDISDYRLLSKADGIQSDDHLWMLGTVFYSGKPVLRMRLKTAWMSTATVNGYAGVLEPGRWAMATATFDGLWLRLYKDADQVGLGFALGPIEQDGDMGAWIGGNPDGESSRPFNGAIDEMAIFHRALTPDEITTLYEARLGKVEVIKWQ